MLLSGTVHCFSQFGAGTLVPGVKTLLSSSMMVHPQNILNEFEVLKAKKGGADAMTRLFVDKKCYVVSPLHKMIGQLLEIIRKSSKKPHGKSFLQLEFNVNLLRKLWNGCVKGVS